MQMNKTRWIAGIAFIFCLGMLVFWLLRPLFNVAGKNLELVEVTPQSQVMGTTENLTFNQVMNQYASHILLGTIVGDAPFTNSSKLFQVQVDRLLVGDLSDQVVEVYIADEDLLEIGETYLFFLDKESATVHAKDFYVQLNEFILKVEDDQVKRLVNIEQDEYVPPFTDTSYNQLATVLTYIEKHAKTNRKESATAVEEAADGKELQALADHIVEVTIQKVEPMKNSLSAVEFEVLQTYKGKKLKNVHALLLPDEAVETGKTYLLFLKKEEDHVTLATRKGSIIEAHDAQFDEMKEGLSK